MTETPEVVDHPLTTLARELAGEQSAKNVWRITALFLGTITVLLGVGLWAMVDLNVRQNKSLAAYRDRCIDVETAEKMIHTTQRVNDINEQCIESHRRHMSVLREALPGLFIDQDRITPWGLFAEEGGKSERKRKGKRRRKSKRKAVPQVPYGQGGG